MRVLPRTLTEYDSVKKPKVDLEAFEPGKEKFIYAFGPQDVEAIADNSITLVRKIERTIVGHEKRIEWLVERGIDSYFPASVFD